MYFADFQDLVKRNQASNAQITFYRDPKINPNNIAIFDRMLLRRKPEVAAETGYAEEDHWRDSKVCELEFNNGEIPLEGNEFFERGRPYRGALSALTIMLNEGCLRRTHELRHLFAEHGRRFPQSAV